MTESFQTNPCQRSYSTDIIKSLVYVVDSSRVFYVQELPVGQLQLFCFASRHCRVQRDQARTVNEKFLVTQISVLGSKIGYGYENAFATHYHSYTLQASPKIQSNIENSFVGVLSYIASVKLYQYTRSWRYTKAIDQLDQLVEPKYKKGPFNPLKTCKYTIRPDFNTFCI